MLATVSNIPTELVTRDTKRQRLDAPPTCKVYYRQLRYPSVSALCADLNKYIINFPGESVWVALCLRVLSSMKDTEPAFLHYAGITTRSAVNRVIEDRTSDYTRWKGWMGESKAFSFYS